jgi:sortase A
MYIKPLFVSQSFTSPIPQTTIMTQNNIQSLIRNTATQMSHMGDTTGKSWLPNTKQYNNIAIIEKLSNYYLSIPSLGIDNAYVSTTDNNVNLHLVHFPGTAIPPNTGNTAIFGHSTLPQWFDPRNPKAIFATLHTLKVGNIITTTVGGRLFTYKIINIRIVEADETSYLAQDPDGSYLSIITCTPPGTTWKRLVIKAKLENAS